MPGYDYKRKHRWNLSSARYVGVAYDGDGDRAIFVDEKGEIHWGDRTFALIE